MLICSCTIISDHDIELALLDIMTQPDPPLPTPGVIWRHLNKRMNCCGCAPLAIETIYAKLEDLERRRLVCPNACSSIKRRLLIAKNKHVGQRCTAIDTLADLMLPV